MKVIRLNWTVLLLTLILGLALGARAYGLSFPRYHWDENVDFDSVLYASFNHLELKTYLHGSFLQYLILVVWYANLVLGGQWPTTENLLMAFYRDAMPFVLLARGLLVLAGTATVAGVYFLGRRLYGATIGLLATFFLALMFLHTAESHYARGHILSTFFVTLAAYFCARILDEARTPNYVLAGVSIGLATAAQYSAILALLSLLAAHAVRAWTQRDGAGWRAWLLDRKLLLGLDSAGIAFFLVTPYALLNFRFFAGEIISWLLYDASRTWVSAGGQPVLLFYLTEHLRNGMGTALEVCALAGVVYALYRRQSRDVVLLAFPIPLFLTLGQGANLARYVLPILPFLAIAAARLLYEIAQWTQRHIGARWAQAALIVFAVVLVIPSAMNTVRFDFWLTQPDTRLLTSRWILANVPDEAKIVVEGAGVLGPPVPSGRAWIDAQIAVQPRESLAYLHLEAERASLPDSAGYRVEVVFRLDQRGGMFVGTVKSAQFYADQGIDYLVTVDWMQRGEQESYTSAFQTSLDVAYARVAEFRPTIAFRFDPYAWRMDYEALARVVPGRPEIGGPRLTIYRRRSAEYGGE